ncbi:MAG: hypothetical protein N3D11_06775 [Candidatus Sumerlaeia bacterium]|nr:hypothetical protein [Candidatus Sumerlaeia bacterium]
MERRAFCSRMGTLPVSLLAANQAVGAPAKAKKAEAAPGAMPQIPFGKYTVSRLVVGANPFHAGSHLSVFVNNEMRAYYTTEQKLQTLRRCEAAGISLWQGSDQHHWVYRQYREQGGKMLYISLGRGDVPDAGEYLKQLLDVGCIGIAHHGEVTDSLFKAGKLDRIHDYLKRVRDAGVLVGVSTHMPDVVDAVESKGWDIDFYMTCVYERHRTREELKKMLGYVPIPVREVYLEEDPPRMFKAMRQTRRTCFAFKILAAGRLCDRKESVEQAFRQTFEGIKPTDGVIVGIYDKFSDQAAENAEYTRRFSALSHS